MIKSYYAIKSDNNTLKLLYQAISEQYEINKFITPITDTFRKIGLQPFSNNIPDLHMDINQNILQITTKGSGVINHIIESAIESKELKEEIEYLQICKSTNVSGSFDIINVIFKNTFYYKVDLKTLPTVYTTKVEDFIEYLGTVKGNYYNFFKDLGESVCCNINKLLASTVFF